MRRPTIPLPLPPRTPPRIPTLALASALGLALALAAPAAAALPVGWSRVELPASGSYALRYVPVAAAAAAGRGEALPLVVFLHGAGAGPEGYTPYVRGAADATGAVVLMPRSLLVPLGWGAAGDPAMVGEALERHGAEAAVEADRVAVAGHSAGGAYAYLLAYASDLPFSAVFTLAASYYPVSALADPDHVPPIRMFYGAQDPNYTAARPPLVEQWERLGVPWEEVVDPAAGHGALPAGAMADGFAWLLTHRRGGAAACTAGDTVLCLHDGRFRVEVAWRDGAGGGGPARVVPLASADSGLFWFFHPDNWEMLVKVLDGCGVDGHFWVFAAATTDVAHTLAVTDTATGRSWSRDHAGAAAAPTVTATDALPCAP